MLQTHLRTYLTKLLTPPDRFQELRTIWILCLLNVGLIVLLGGLMMSLSGHYVFFLLTLLMMGSAGSMIFFLLIRLAHLTLVATKQHLDSVAYEKTDTPLLILTPDLHLAHSNKKARENCWWASHLTVLRNVLMDGESQVALERLVEGLHKKQEAIETLYLRGKKGKETWKIHATPMGKHALWQCHNITQEKNQNAAYISQLNTMTLMMDHAPEAIFSLNKKGTILFCNQKFAQYLGYERHKLIGAPFSKFLAKPRTMDPLQPFEIQGKCELVTASSRIKTVFLEQTQISHDNGSVTYSLAHLHTPLPNQDELRKILEIIPLPVLCMDERWVIQDSNLLFRETYWANEDAVQGTSFLDLVATAQKEEVTNALNLFLKEENGGAPLEIHFKDSRESIVSAYIAPLPLKNQRGLFVQFHDITEQKRIENQLILSQKMQAMGQLAGGIAHDFNNLLTVMIGFCDILLLRYTPGDPSFTDIMQIKQNASRATNLVRQLLAFSRQQTLQPRVLDITECLAETSALLRRLIDSSVELRIKYARGLGLVLVDQGQFEQVIVNLVVNARDAMAGGGEITVTTKNYELKKSKTYGQEVIPAGPYVLVEVTDTGEGIPPELIDQIFEPFFSTKEKGSGTGLGLATVYGIVRQTGGFISVTSKVGEGSTFSLYFPRVTDETKLATPRVKDNTASQDLTGSSTILLVEDEDAVRVFSARALRSKGYNVLEAMNGVEALKLINSTTEKIELVITDVVMPQMDGPSFVNKINELGISPKVLFMSGYAEDTFRKQLKDEEGMNFLSKPFNLIELATRVKEVLEKDFPPVPKAS